MAFCQDSEPVRAQYRDDSQPAPIDPSMEHQRRRRAWLSPLSQAIIRVHSEAGPLKRGLNVPRNRTRIAARRHIDIYGRYMRFA